MIAPSLVTAASVREYMGLNAVSSDSRYSDATLGSNIRAAGWFLERATGRRFADRTETLTFTTNGATFMAIPSLRTATAVTLLSGTLVENSTYFLIPDAQQTGVAVGIQFRPFLARGTRDYLTNPEWFDRGLDLHNPYGFNVTSQPNDLSIAGSWGYTDVPEPILHATKVLAAYYTKRPDAVLSGAITTESGIFDLSNMPIEVTNFIREWNAATFVTGTG